MPRAQLLELEFEDNICQAMAERGWLYEDHGDTTTAGWDIGLAMVPQDVLHWLQTQYPDEYEKAVPSDLVNSQLEAAQKKLLKHITTELAKSTRMDPNTGHPVGGLLGVLRKGFNYAQVGRPSANFGPMMEFPPANPNLIEVVEASDAVRLRILRQVRFDTKTNQRLDMVLCSNGIPVATLELKTDNTQTVNHAIRQYKQDRKPGKTRPLLAPGRALVHFAVSNDEVYMTTKLDGANTTFLPFNQGNDGHAGNPPSPTGSNTDYLWRHIFDRPLFMRIIKHYALYEPGKRGSKNDGRLIFPRFHQLRAVERIVDDIEHRGPGGRYLVWHSAGSGKTKTIAWLSHRLIRHMNDQSKATFDSVIVVTDRTVLDENIREDMNLVQASHGLVVTVGEKSGPKSPQLKKALLDGNHIITCTLQTFPEVMKLIEDTNELRGRNWAVVADEAHSSQTGSTARQLKELLTDPDIGDDHDISADDLLAAKDTSISESSNITFVALTATPKPKTLRLFGTQIEEERWEAFDTYTMAQAIEEGFILDVLTNYTTYDMFLQVKNRLDNSEEHIVDTGEAVTKIVKYARLHPTSIAQKVRVVVEHFRRNVAHMLNGTARAMVVTSSRKAAYHWSESMNAYIENQGYEGLGTLVAFSGPLTADDGSPVTEASLNGRVDTAAAFKEDGEYRVLIVADKFQTGFDEPRLMAMYVDKKLTGVATVQTLSRLNRIYPGKTDPMIVDFVNSPENIQQDFKMYYSDAYVRKEVDPNALHTIGERMDTADIYTNTQMQELADAYINEVGGEAIRPIVNQIKHRWNGRLRQAVLSKDTDRRKTLEAFRSDVIKYRNAWQFLSQIINYDDPAIHQRAILASLLARNLHLTPEDTDEDYLAGIQLTGVQVSPSSIAQDYSLTEGETGGMEPPGFGGELLEKQAGAKGPLEEAIDRVNELFATKNFDLSEGSVAGFITTYWGFLDNNQDAVAMAKNNSVDQLKASEGFANAVGLAMFQAFQETEEIRQYVSDPEILRQLAEISADALHAQYHNRKPGQEDA